MSLSTFNKPSLRIIIYIYIFCKNGKTRITRNGFDASKKKSQQELMNEKHRLLKKKADSNQCKRKALEKSMELDEMVEEQMKEHEERRTLMNPKFQMILSKINKKQLTIEPQNSIEVSRDAQNALLKSQETWQRIQNTKSNYDKLIRIQEQQSDPETATQAMKNLWNTQQKEDAKAKRNMKKTSFR
ncbi:unnamed protein product [Lepeophtheirus salmonis]|uniref:(salmon louse) hypothetical protein n=1 Tax=Lepeophtheirus salmonis TaxID=72036 RepID=A0A7R8CQG5_LEPSM|nr:unnamed protein product [Lepeophtheirus salmonis]CAF2861317.1 unnamed protein product [Lepeophtheirus salmonis]